MSTQCTRVYNKNTRPISLLFLIIVLISPNLLLPSEQTKYSPLRIRCNIQNYKKRDLSICSFGASVVQQKNSIFDHFVKELNRRTNRKHRHIKIASGGDHLYASSVCLIDEVIALKPDICIVDWFDTGYINTSYVTDKCLETIIRKLREIDCSIICYYHIRNNYTDQNRLEFISHIDRICYKHNVTAYYEYDAIQLRQKEISQELLRDGVHTTPYGSIFLGSTFCDYFMRIPITEDTIIHRLPDKNDFYNVKTIPVNNGLIQGDFFIDEEGYYVLGKESALSLDMQGQIVGCNIKKGPYSPVITITIDADQVDKFCIWDPYCHYERKAIQITTKRASKNIKITIADDEIDYSTCRREFYFSGIEKLFKIKEIFVVRSDLQKE